ncbi:MAG: RluA family pseudouridine synthase [Alphaproteobacteria bacterium]|nr:RluA family pseudouridine synthase [Alphaproteobacteria bacterium]
MIQDIGTKRTLIIPESLAGQRLDKALTVLAPESEALSRARIQALVAEGHVSLGGRSVVEAKRKVKTGETYVLILPPPQKTALEAQAMPLSIVYEDDDVIVVDKPAGLVVHPAPGNRDHTLVNALLAHCGDSLSGIGGVARPGIVHRLDKDTSGLMVVAKRDKAHQALSAQFADRSLSRTYRALVWGIPVPPSGTVDAPIGRSPRDRKKMAVSGKGRAAVTHYKTIEVFDGVSLVECVLKTGRTHQIRVHMAHIKHPVVGDPVYGKRAGKTSKAVRDAVDGFPRQALHAVKLRFVHPETGRVCSLTSPLPDDMAGLLRRLRQTRNG